MAWQPILMSDLDCFLGLYMFMRSLTPKMSTSLVQNGIFDPPSPPNNWCTHVSMTRRQMMFSDFEHFYILYLFRIPKRNVLCTYDHSSELDSSLSLSMPSISDSFSFAFIFSTSSSWYWQPIHVHIYGLQLLRVSSRLHPQLFALQPCLEAPPRQPHHVMRVFSGLSSDSPGRKGARVLNVGTHAPFPKLSVFHAQKDPPIPFPKYF